ncbi:MAG: hypothetical protein RBG13Loki_0420 [Promethearchaeota archaeon CR_4]|nr:MAG: hypothetical protein RBG13Loki_0420 [Candidatus Lokiarchaeota archaeon CR_4]
MVGIEISYAIELERVIKILQALSMERPDGIKINDLFKQIDYSDATGKSMHIRFLESNGLIVKPSGSTIAITKEGKKLLNSDDSAKRQHYIKHLDEGIIEILKLLAIAKNNQLSIDQIFERLQKMHNEEKPRMIGVKKAFAKKILEYTGLVESISQPEPSWKLSFAGQKFIDDKANISMQSSGEEPDTSEGGLISIKKEKDEVKDENREIESENIEEKSEKVEVKSKDTQKNKVADGSVLSKEEKALKSKIKKSIRYPFFPLEKSLEFAALIGKMAGYGEVQIDSIVRAMEYTSERTKGFTYAKSTAEQFNLIQQGNQGLKLTDLGKKLVFDEHPDHERKQPLLQEAFFAVPLYLAIQKKYKSLKIPDDKFLKKALMDMGIAEDATDTALNCFKDSAKFSASIIDNKFIDFVAVQKKNIEKTESDSVKKDATLTSEKNEPHLMSSIKSP